MEEERERTEEGGNREKLFLQ